jgi:hypothetical protein
MRAEILAAIHGLQLLVDPHRTKGQGLGIRFEGDAPNLEGEKPAGEIRPGEQRPDAMKWQEDYPPSGSLEPKPWTPGEELED